MKDTNNLERQVITDDLTGLYNRRYLNVKLREETERALHAKKAHFGLIMLDLDHFKDINDTFGHQEGDQALLWISNILKLSVRECDIIIRFAGDEFFIILPGAGLNESRAVSERIYSNISKKPFKGSLNQVDLPVGISGGIAIFPDDASTIDDLIKSVDGGLYLAKEKGRGKICLASEAKLLKKGDINKTLIMDPPFSGRKEELKELKKIWQEVKDSGRLAGVLLKAENGAGKSRLISEHLNQTDKAYHLKSYCRSHNVEIPYQVFIDILNRWIETDPAIFRDVFYKLSVREQTEILRLVPNIEEIEKQTQTDSVIYEDSIHNSRLYYAIANLFKIVSKDFHLILIIEDMQWIDSSSLDLLSHVLMQNTNSPIMVIMSVQNFISQDKKNSLLTKFFRQMEREIHFVEKYILPFSGKEVQSVLKKIFMIEDSKILEELGQFLFKESEGNPFYLKELIIKVLNEKILYYTVTGWKIKKNISINTPEKIKDIIKEKVEGIDPELKSFLMQLSVLGMEFTFEYIKKLTEMNEGHIIDLIESALNSAFIEEKKDSEEEAYTFSSLQCQKVLYNELSNTRKRRIHHQILEMYEKDLSESKSENIEQIFYHAQEAGDDEKTFYYGYISGKKAFENFALEQSYDFLKEALKCYGELKPSVQKQYEDKFCNAIFIQCEVLSLLGKYDLALEESDKMPSSPEKDDLCGFLNFKKGNYSLSRTLYLRAFNNSQNQILKSKIKARLAIIFLNQGMYKYAIESARDSFLISSKAHNSYATGLSLKTLGSVEFSQANYVESIRYYTKSLKEYYISDDKDGIASCLNNIALIHYQRKKYIVSVRCFQKAMDITSEYGLLSLNLQILNNLGSLYVDMNLPDKAEECFTRCLELAKDSGEASIIIACHANLGLVLKEKDLEKSEAHNLEGLDLCKKVGETSKEYYFYNILGELSFIKGNHILAEEWFKKGYQLAKDFEDHDKEIYSGIKILELFEKTGQKKSFLEFYNALEIKLKDVNATERITHLSNEMKAIKERFIQV